MVSNDMAETLINSTSPPPLYSNRLCNMSNYCFDLSRDLYYKTPTKIGSKRLQQFIWKVRSFKISISNGLQQSQTLLKLKTPPPKDSYGLRLCYGKFRDVISPTLMDSTICMLFIYLIFSELSVDIPSTMDSNGLQ